MKNQFFHSAALKMILLLAVFFTISSCKKEEGDNTNTVLDLSCTNITADKTLEQATYNVDCIVTVTNGAVLTISPGSIFKFTGNGGFVTSGGAAIKAVGTSAKPILFTGKEAIIGFWYSVDINTNSLNNQFAYCTFEYGGKGSTQEAMVRVGSSSIGRAKFENCTFRNGLKNGLYFAYHSFIEGSTNNTFTGNTDYPVSTDMENVSQLTADNTYTGNGKDQIYIFSDYTPNADITFNKIGAPYYIAPNSNELYEFQKNVVVKPGVTLIMGQDVTLRIDGAQSSFNCVGTSSQRITIKGEEDIKGFWDKIQFFGTPSSLNQIKYTDISNGGNRVDNLWLDPGTITSPNVVKIVIENTSITKSQNWGIYFYFCNSSQINGTTGVAAIKAALEAANVFDDCGSGGTDYVMTRDS